MREIVTAVEMKELDHNTIQKAGISSPVLMERAALKTVEEIVQRLKNKEKEKILVVCGTGNNGGDGLAIARLLQLRGVRTWYYIAGTLGAQAADLHAQKLRFALALRRLLLRAFDLDLLRSHVHQVLPCDEASLGTARAACPGRAPRRFDGAFAAFTLAQSGAGRPLRWEP